MIIPGGDFFRAGRFLRLTELEKKVSRESKQVIQTVSDLFVQVVIHGEKGSTYKKGPYQPYHL